MGTTFLTRSSFLGWVIGICHQEAMLQNKEEIPNKHKYEEYCLLEYDAM
jgi:hypothetical protein